MSKSFLSIFLTNRPMTFNCCVQIMRHADKPEARQAPGSLHLYSEVVYSRTVHLYTNSCLYVCGSCFYDLGISHRRGNLGMMPFNCLMLKVMISDKGGSYLKLKKNDFLTEIVP